MKTTPKVSIIVPVYNADDYLTECLDSLKNQSLTSIEIICVNNGSTDNSKLIIQKYIKLDPRFHLINIPPSNAGAARNAGLQEAHGEYLSFIDADDFCELNMFELLYQSASANHSDIVICEFRTYDNLSHQYNDKTSGIAKNIKSEAFTPTSIKTNIFGAFKNCPWNKLFKRDFIITHQLKFQEIPRGNDIYFTYLSLVQATKISVIRLPLINYRVNNQKSLQNTNISSPLSFMDAFKYVKNQLIVHNIYQIYEQSFLTELLNNAIYNLEKLPFDSNAYNYLYYTIKYGIEIDFQIKNHPASFYNVDSYSKYLTIVNSPTPSEIIEKAMKEIRSSHSYRIGTAITKIPRKFINLTKRSN